MTHIFRDPAVRAFFALTNDYLQHYSYFEDEHQNLITILWNREDTAIELQVDEIPMSLGPNQLTTLTYLHKVKFPHRDRAITAFTFNRDFYCIQDHDQEVSCNGIIFFGTQDNPIVTLDKEEQRKFDLLYQVFDDEFKTRDNIQGEMLRMLLKRLIIKVTRLAKSQLITHELDDVQIDLVRKFNVLVDLHYREKKQVSDYAELLFKSPKTLSNLFARYNQKSPLTIIHERIVLEANRLLRYTDKTAKEVAHELGFEEVASFHKLFKRITGQTPQEFKRSLKSNA